MSDRAVHLSTSRFGRVPRRYRGRDILEWWAEMKFLDVSYASLEGKSIARAAVPQTSGLGRQGAVILGRLLDINAGTFVLGR